MTQISLKDAKATFSHVIDKAAAGEFVTITRHGRAAAVIVSVDAAEAARKAMAPHSQSLVDYLKTFPDMSEGDVFARNPAPSRDIEL
ncbi:MULTISPECIES: type II toxin-antitoxin system Phd/YefM family antitoxin [unclassified Rhizobium]|uniref:type II toxin-antitoxin system Phd/YefM family antitoxin n=1 Tax=unclassified Rhizobium TaxID=2613769 RepID=UPI0006F2620F|nr:MULTISPECIES: type II toxin-antitoxin system Phd/YefM family antitoxin [unclassified Rhizobium]KQV43677.1 prevent-host-death protein [Rhizobium sp. Root1212]KRD37861.1 prevent-host-death protein [Rhizobium sp. Root268]